MELASTSDKTRQGSAKLLSAPEIIKKFNISYQTLNYYTTIGLLSNAMRKGRTRYYDEDEVARRLEKIRELQNKGYPLKLIFELINSHSAKVRI